MEMLSYMDKEHPEIGQQIETVKTLDDELNAQILDAVKAFKAGRRERDNG